jgi:hypothetical protein
VQITETNRVVKVAVLVVQDVHLHDEGKHKWFATTRPIISYLHHNSFTLWCELWFAQLLVEYVVYPLHKYTTHHLSTEFCVTILYVYTFISRALPSVNSRCWSRLRSSTLVSLDGRSSPVCLLRLQSHYLWFCSSGYDSCISGEWCVFQSRYGRLQCCLFSISTTQFFYLSCCNTLSFLIYGHRNCFIGSSYISPGSMVKLCKPILLFLLQIEK